ncbi:MAG TPA: cytochrome b561 domain-containing protein [Smithellaceae bacterium]|nr:cytochrome b561 domain-containing protein [Smithellaceae bacterium]
MAGAVLTVFAGVGFAMFLRRKKYWLKLHKMLNSAGSLFFVVGFSLIFILLWEQGAYHLGGVHQIIGLTTVILALITLLAGFYQLKAGGKAPLVRQYHRWLGRLVLALSVVSLLTGLRLAGII